MIDPLTALTAVAFAAVLVALLLAAAYVRRGSELAAHRLASDSLEIELRGLIETLETEYERVAAGHTPEALVRIREFVGNVSHELRTPLASLKALAETLEEGALDDPPAARDFLAQMHVEVDSLTQLVQELLELSRIESGQVPLKRESISPKDLLHTAERRLRRQAERLGLTLAVADESDTPLPDVSADPHLVERVLLNLVHNALKFTPHGGSVHLSASPHPAGVSFSVQDTGIGLPAEELDRIFERFHKVDRSRASRGTGLGLAIAKHIVQAHGGTIWAQSEGDSHGTTIRFTLPRANPVPASPLASAYTR